MKRFFSHSQRGRRSSRPSATHGFSMVEMLVSGVVGAITITSVATLNTATHKELASARASRVTSVEVANNLAALRNLADVYAWSSAGTGTVTLSSDICKEKHNGDGKKHGCDDYFVPSKNGNKAAHERFQAACTDTSNTNRNLLLAPLISAIASVPEPAGVRRRVNVHDGIAKQLLVSYSSDTISHSALIVPKLASLCP